MPHVLRRLSTLGTLLLALAPAALAQSFVVTASEGPAPAPEAHVRVEWTPTEAPGEIYEIRRYRIQPGDAAPYPEGELLAVRAETDSLYLDTATAPGVAYSYCVRATAAPGTPQACDTGSRALRVPTALGATDRTRTDGVGLTWTDRSTVETGYAVFRGPQGAPQTVAGLTRIATTGPDASGYLDTEGDPLTAYTYCVGLVEASSGAAAVAPGLACATGTRGAVLPPATVAASDGTFADRVRVAWARRPGTSYAVYRDAAGQPRQTLGTDLDAAVYDDLSAVEGTAYTYCVTASADGAESVEVCDAGRRGGLTPPADVAASDGASDSVVEVTWTDPGDEESGFRVYRRPAAGGADETLADLPADRTRYVDRTAVPGTVYAYSVAAFATVSVDGADVTTESARGTDTGVRAALLAPGAFAATDAAQGDEGHVALAWESASDVVQLFRVVRDGAVLATLPPSARSYRDVTALSGVTYAYKVQSMTVVETDAAMVAQGLAPIFSRARAEREGLAADRLQAFEDGARAVARVDAQIADAEAALVSQLQGQLQALGVDAAALGASAAGVAGNLEIRDSNTDAGSRVLKRPGALAATTTHEDRIRLTWEDRSGKETEYEVHAVYTPTDSVVVFLGPNRTEWVDVGAPAGADVTYRVRVLDRDPAEALSASAWATVVGRRELAVPTDLAAAQTANETEILLTWTDQSRAESEYLVTVGLASGNWVGTTGANGRQLVVPIGPGDFGRALSFNLIATDRVDALPGVASQSAAAGVTITPTLLAPRVVTASTEYPNQVVIAWSDESSANDGYRVVRLGASPATLTATGTTAIDEAPAGPADYCVTPTLTGAVPEAVSDAEPEPVCASGRVSASTAPSTGDVVSTFTRVGGLGTGPEGFGAVLAAEDGLLVVGAPDDAFVFEASNQTPVWARPLAPSLADDPVGTGYYFNEFAGWNPDAGNTGHFEVVGSMGLTSFYTRTPEGGWSNVSNIQLQATDAFTYRRFGADVDIDGDIAIIGAPGPATFHTHPILKRSAAPQYISSVTYGDGGAYIYQRGSDGTWTRVGTLRGLGFASNSFTPNDALTRTAPFGVDEFAGISFLTTRKYQDFGPYGSFYLQSLQEIRNDSRPLHVERMGELVALTSKWAVSSFVYRTRPSGPNHVVGLYRSTGPYDYIGILDGPAGFDSATGALAADDSAVGTVVAIGSGAGAVRLHELNAAGTSVAETDLAPATGPSSEFGASVDVVADGAMAADGHLVVVGAPGAGDNAVYIYRRTSGFSWTLEQRITPELGDTRFGTSVAIGDGLIAVGAEKDGAPGVAYTLRLDSGIWVRSARLTPDPAAGVVAESRFGAAVASDADDLVIGAPGTRAEGRQQGSIYFATVSVSPSGVDASDGRYANRVQVRWEDETGVEDGYRVYRRGPTDTDHELVGTLGPNAEVFDDFDVSPGDVYQYCVASFLGEDETNTNPLGESGRACDAGYTPPNGTITGRLATGEGAPVLGAGVCLAPGLDQAVMFDGLGGRAVVSNFGALPAAFTVQAWVHADGYSDGANPVVGVDGASYAMLEIVGASGAGSPRLRVLNDGDAAATVIDAPALAPGWHHLAATHDGTTLALYVDGQPAGTAAFAGASAARGAFQMAADRAGNAFDGRLDDVRVWSRALTPAQVATAHQQAQLLQGDEVDLYAYWAIDQGIGRIVTDLTAGGRHATLQAGAEWTQEGAPLNTCALSDGDGNYTFAGLRYGDRTAFRITPTDSTRQFTPRARTATLTPESPTTNLVDFTDTSSFTVRGRVVHPVDYGVGDGPGVLAAPDVEILVDGTVTATTEADGTFAVAVRGTGEHVFEARNDSLGLAFRAVYGTTPFTDGTAEIDLTGDVDGLTFESTTRRILRGQAMGGCGAGVGPVTLRLYTEDRRFSHEFTTAVGASGVPEAYVFNLPPLEYRLEFVSVGDVPAPLSRTRVIDYYRNLGVLSADLRAEADTVDFRYRAPITLVVERDGLAFAQSTTCTAPYTLVDADGNPERTLPNVPVIEEYERVPLVFRAYEDYGNGAHCPVDVGTVRVFDGFADAADEPVEVELTDGTASYTTFGRSPDTFAGRTIGGVDRSYQKSLTAVLEIPDGPSVTTTEWAFVEGYREKPATFVTATTSEIPLMVLRDPPGSQSSAFIEEGTSSCMNISTIQTLTGSTGASFEIETGIKALLGIFYITEAKAGIVFTGQTTLGATTEQSLGRDANIEVCATTTERIETNGGTGWSSEDVYAGVGLNLIFALADVVTADTSAPGACTINLSTTVATDLDNADPFETTFTYGTSHIEDVLIPNLEQLAALAGGEASVEGEIDGNEEAVTLRQAVENWEGMIVYNDSLVTEALAGEVENRSFSGGTSFQYGTSRDTTWTSTQSYAGFLKVETGFGFGFNIAGVGANAKFAFNFETQTKHTRTETDGSSFSTGYTLADDDAGDYFTVDVAQDPRYGTYVFNTVSGASSNPWEPGTQKRDLPRLAIDPPLVGGVAEDGRAVFTLQLTNASESDERRTYVIEAPGELNPSGATVQAYGGALTARTYAVDADQTINVPITVGRGPGPEAASDTARVGIVAFAPGDLHAVATDTVWFEARFTPSTAPVRLVEPLAGWAVNAGSRPSVQVTLSEIDLGSQARVGVQFRPAGGAWKEAFGYDADALDGATEVDRLWVDDELPDGAYELRAFALPASPSGTSYTGPAVPGWIDRRVPTPFGAPQPADAVLALGETIGVTFEEAVDCTALRAGLAVDVGHAELTSPTRGPIALDVGCADQTVLLAPQDPSLWAAIEGQLVNASLRGVTDLAGNPMQQVDWRFTVRRNAFGWTPAIDSARVQPGVPADLRAALVNGRAQPVSYLLLADSSATAVPATPFLFRPIHPDGSVAGGTPVPVPVTGLTGTVVAGNVQPITLRWPAAVDGADIPEGLYRATIYVRGSEAGESLPVSPFELTVKIAREAPDWVVHAAAFEHSMSVTASLLLGGAVAPSQNPDDRVAAFVDGEVRGVSSPQEMALDAGGTAWRVPLLVYGPGDAESVTFQVWDAAAREVHTTTSQVIEFAADGKLGTADEPLVIEAPGANGGPLEVPLAQGWTWVSTNRTGTSLLASALAGVGTAETDLIQGSDGFSQYVPGSGWFGDVGGMSPGAGYHVRLAAPATMVHPGATVAADTPIALLAGWNWIGYLPSAPLSVDAALGAGAFATDDLVKGREGYAQFVEGAGWFGSLDEMAPGLGYQLYTTEDGTLTYPAGSPRLAASVAPLAARPVRRMDTLPRYAEPVERRTIPLPSQPAPAVLAASQTSAQVQPFEHSMVVTATLGGAADSVAVAAYALADGVETLRAVAEVASVDALGGTRVFLLVPGETGEQIVLRAVAPDGAGGWTPLDGGDLSVDNGTARTAATWAFDPDAVVGSVADPVMLSAFGATSADADLPAEVGLEPTRPNPVSGTATFVFGLPTPVPVRLAVYDVLGREVAVLADGPQPAGVHTLTLDGRSLAAGTYVARLVAGPDVRVQTFTIVR